MLISYVFNCQDCTLQFDSQIKDLTETHDGNIVFISENSKITKVDLNFDTICKKKVHLLIAAFCHEYEIDYSWLVL